ncbi:secreted RxLR effector protein 161-like [Salvia splendens]|uniref:secreted RxLR effector protein 161-like n=1 Tax=Salvia splendens TaxID=180675 RepID=UPI001C26788F|nr:secreted RxLR effector protein 161-like [Salvia splendens]
MTTPMESYLKLAKDEGKLLADATLFRQLVGSLFYLPITRPHLSITRPDISFSVGVISQFMGKPREPQLIAAKRILRYIKNTLHFILHYKQGTSFLLSGFVDADWAGDMNDRRSTIGYCFDRGSAAISWCSKKQSTVALSNCEADGCSRVYLAQEARPRNFCDLKYSVLIRCDNVMLEQNTSKCITILFEKRF